MGTALLGWAILIQVNRPGAFPIDPFFFLIGVTYALSLVYLTTLRFVDRFPWLADAQLAVDALLVSGFIGLTGGIVSYFSSLYVLPIIAASMIRFRRGALQLAAVTAVLYCGMIAAQYLGVTPSWLGGSVLELPSRQFAQYTIGINLFGFAAVGLLSGSLAERLRSADVRLEHASHEIEDLRAFNEYVIDGLLSGLVTADGDLRILTFNRAAAGITGIPAEQAVGQDAREVLQLPPNARTQLAVLPQTRSIRVEFEYRSGDGRLLDVGLMATTLALPNGRNGYLFTFQDVTELRRLERNARLQQRLAAVGEMAAGIAHEIRNPLAAISGSMQVLRQELPLNEEQGQLMDIVLKESERLNDTIRSFLAYARPLKFQITQVDVAKIVQDAAVLLRNSAEARPGHTIEVQVPPTPLWLDADENQVRQIIWNIASNGLRAMPDGGRLRLVAESTSGPDEVVLGVSDEGRGIPAEELDTIFQPFRGSFDKGTGLGLAIVHRIVSDYGGNIEVSSDVGVGTTVRVRLPLRPAAIVGQGSRRPLGLRESS
ncbi:MAG: PAS domain-containing protein [Acidobacteria bacterium]|nr:PAS domain-containing protein [Acidobacteriota bacterium]